MTGNYIDRFNPTRRAQLNDLLLAVDGARIFTILAGCFPASEEIQGAFIAIANDLSPDRYDVLRQLYDDKDQRRVVIETANVAHRHNGRRPYNVATALDLPSKMVVHILRCADLYQPYLHYLPEIINTFDIKDVGNSRLRTNHALGELRKTNL